jgi:hypothetical protein
MYVRHLSHLDAACLPALLLLLLLLPLTAYACSAAMHMVSGVWLQ